MSNKKLAEYRGTFYGFPIYWEIDVGKDKEMKDYIEKEFNLKLRENPRYKKGLIRRLWAKIW